jgi:hypothetical protein
MAAMVDDVVVGCEHAVRQPVVAHELPDVLGGVQLRTFWRQRQKGDVGGDVELVGGVPARLIEKQDGVRSGGDILGDFLQMEVHGERVALGHDQPGALALLGADRAENVRRGGALIVGRAGARSFLGPTARDLVFLADPSLVLEPDFYSFGDDAFFARDFLQARGETFLKSSIAPSAWA